MNSKSTNRPAGKPTSRPDARGGAKAMPKGKALRPGEKTMPSEGYGVYREAAAPAKAPPAGRAPAAPALAEALRVVTAEIKTLKNDVAQKDTEIKALQKRLTQMEARQKSQEKAYRALQYPAGATGRSVVTEQPDSEETTEEQTAPLKALDE